MKNKSALDNIYPLFLSHQIFVTKEQRYELYQGEKVETVGSFIETTNINNVQDFFPKEIFARYIIDSLISDEHITSTADGYKIHMPVKFLYSDADLENVDLDSTVFIEDILDNEDGGREEIFFKWRKILISEKNKKYIIMHSVSIRDIEVLRSSASFVKYN
jgi:hypothetical protein